MKALSGGGDGGGSPSADKKEAGFTIVEVMIVLAIAGLVLAIVFIAVPALQRNSRNTQRRADLGGLRAQVETWTSNNGGKIPSTLAHYNSIIGSTGWGHYNGNLDEPLPVWDTTAVSTENSEPYEVVGFTKPTTARTLTGVGYPNREVIHIWFQYECGDTILAGGRDDDVAIGTLTIATSYATPDLAVSNARAIAYVYQVEGEDNARCEDNV